MNTQIQIEFQTLIGILQTKRQVWAFYAEAKVSNPYRYSTNFYND